MALFGSSRVFAACRTFSRFRYLLRAQAKERDHIQITAKPLTCLSANEDFKIRLITTEQEFQSVIINAMVREGWRPGLKDAECFLACDPISAFVGELKGTPVCCITVTKYGKSFAFGGCFYVSKEHRGKGYGRKIYDAAKESTMMCRSIGISALLELEGLYKRKGFRSLFHGAHFLLHPSTALCCFSETSEGSPVKINRIDEVNLEALFSYDTKVFGFERHAFLSKWFGVTGSHARVAVNSEGSIVGYTVARPTFVKDEGYKIGPLFADSEPIAEKLLKAVFEELLRQRQPSLVVSIDTPTKKATELGERLQGKRLFEHVYMVIGDTPDACFDKWFGHTTTQLG